MYADNRNRWHLLHLAEGSYKIYKNVWLFQYLEFYTSLTFKIIILQFWQHKMLNQQLNVSTAQQGVMFECFRSCSCSCACVLPRDIISQCDLIWMKMRGHKQSRVLLITYHPQHHIVYRTGRWWCWWRYWSPATCHRWTDDTSHSPGVYIYYLVCILYRTALHQHHL